MNQSIEAVGGEFLPDGISILEARERLNEVYPIPQRRKISNNTKFVLVAGATLASSVACTKEEVALTLGISALVVAGYYARKGGKIYEIEEGIKNSESIEEDCRIACSVIGKNKDWLKDAARIMEKKHGISYLDAQHFLLDFQRECEKSQGYKGKVRTGMGNFFRSLSREENKEIIKVDKIDPAEERRMARHDAFNAYHVAKARKAAEDGGDLGGLISALIQASREIDLDKEPPKE